VSAIAVGWFYRPTAALSSDRPEARGDSLRAAGQVSMKCLSLRLRVGWRSLRRALASI
jgi:hypothetical protein